MRAGVVEEVLRSRRSCRAFLSRPVDQLTLDAIFETAQQTASWCNSQAWQVVATRGEQTHLFADFLYTLSAEAQMASDVDPPERYVGVYRERRQHAGYGLYASLDISREDGEARAAQMRENFRFFGAPHVAVITSPRSLGSYGLVDCGAYISSVLTVVESHGLAAIAQAAIAMYSEPVRRYLELPEDRVVVAGISIGYADHDHPANSFRTDREKLENVIDWRGREE